MGHGGPLLLPPFLVARFIHLPFLVDPKIVYLNGSSLTKYFILLQDRGKQVSGEGNTSGTVDSRVAPS